MIDKGNVRTEGDDCDPVLTRRSRSAASVDCADPVENQTFFTKSKILEKVVNQVQGDGELEILSVTPFFRLRHSSAEKEGKSASWIIDVYKVKYFVANFYSKNFPLH